MLNINFLACTKVDLWDLPVCSKWRKISESRSVLDLGPTMTNIGSVQDIFIYSKVFKFHVPRSNNF